MRDGLLAAIDAARAARAPRRPFAIGGTVVGSVAEADVDVLAGLGHGSLRIGAATVHLDAPTRDAATTALATLNPVLRDRGLVRAWRDETFAIVDPAGADPAAAAARADGALALTERAASRFWGTLTFGAHATGYVAGADGRPAALWIAQRSFAKPTDPGMLDNLVGGGVPHGQSPAEALVREGFEEAGLAPAHVAAATPAPVLRLHRDIPEGLQHEHLHAFDLPLPPGLAPVNQDGEVAGFRLVPPDEAVALIAAGAMTVDAAVVTLDFLARHGLLARMLPSADAADIGALLHTLRALHAPHGPRAPHGPDGPDGPTVPPARPRA